jgi:hypothetical protein
MRFPDWVGEKAIEVARLESPSFVPTVPIVMKACSETLKPTQDAAISIDRWNTQAAMQLRERTEIDAMPAASKEVIARVVAEMAQHGMYILGSKPTDKGVTKDTLKERFRLSDQQIDALQNSPVNQEYWQGIRGRNTTNGLRQFGAADLQAIYDRNNAA